MVGRLDPADITEQVFAQRGQVRRIHHEQNGVSRRRRVLLGEQEHDGASLAVHARPADSAGPAHLIDELEAMVARIAGKIAHPLVMQLRSDPNSANESVYMDLINRMIKTKDAE